MMMKQILLPLFFVALSYTSLAQTTRFVKEGATGNGSSWANASGDLQLMINTSVDGDQIWVAKGTYKPNRKADNLNNITPNDLNNAFVLKAGVKIYGGFDPNNGIDDLTDTRILPSLGGSILSGDFTGNDAITGSGASLSITNNNDNAYHVVISAGPVGTAELNGFTLTGGNANGSVFTNITVNGLTIEMAYGGGMYNASSSPILTNLNINSNDTFRNGGGMYNASSSPILTNVSINGNNANSGGGMYNNNSSSPILTNVNINGNNANDGGGMYNNNSSSPILTNVTLSGNNAAGTIGATPGGGGMYNTGSSSPKVYNSIFKGNTATIAGAEIYNLFSNATFVNVTLVSNAANALYVNNSISWQNSIIWGGISGGYATKNCIVKGSNNTANGNIDATSITENDIFTNPATGDYTLKPTGPAINKGDNQYVAYPFDFAGSPRIRNNIVDIGAYEVQQGNTMPVLKPNANGVLYVNQNPPATSDKSGDSWANAVKELADALLAANNNTAIKQIWVAKGTYKPMYSPEDGTNFGTNQNQHNTFLMVNNVKLYGGFDPATNKTDLATRNPQLATTTLSGDIGNPNDITDNTYHVIISVGTAAAPITSQTVLDGFTLTGGNANGSSSIRVNNQNIYRYNGGGMYNNYSSPTLTNLSISGNTATQDGGGMYNLSSSPSLTNVSLSGNTATQNGAGMYNINSSSPTLTNVSLSGNTATIYGGGMYNSGFSPTLTNVSLSGNTANTGGGMYNYSSSPTLTNVSLSGNNATNNGGGMYNINSSSPTLTNVSLSGNTANFNGGGMFNNGSSSPKINNSIIWGNTATNNPNINNGTNSNPVYKYSLVQGLGGGTDGNLDGTKTYANLFKDFANGDYSLVAGSPAINTGSNALYEAADGNTGNNSLTTDKDLAGKPRLYNNGLIDMGAYEYQSIVLQPNNGGVLFVNQNVTGGNASGDSWANAVPQLADALKWANENKSSFTTTTPLQIWVAKGNYKPLYRPDNLSGANPNDRDNAFLMVDNVKLYGGFAGTETAANQRTLPANGITGAILSGDLGTVNDITDNTYHVVMAVGTPTLNTFIDGFEITGGNANGGFAYITVNGINVFKNDGGGIYSEASNWSSFASPYSSSVTLNNSNISQNRANGNGGGIFSIANLSSSVTINNSGISQNTANADGGGIYSFSLSNSSSSTLTINNSNISRNSATQGGGLFSYGNNSSSTSWVTLSNSSVSGNTAVTNGGSIYSQSSSTNTINFISSTIAGNEGPSFVYFNSGTKTFKAANSIVYGNTKSDNTASDITGSGSAMTKTITYSLVQGVAADAANGVLDGSTTSTHTITNVFKDFPNGDYSLKTSSPAIGAGNNAEYPGNINIDKDLAGNPRLTGTNIDMGAYEALIQSQAITVSNLVKTYGDAAFEPGATASSGLTVAYLSADNSIAEAYQDNTDNNKWKIRIKKAGTVNITASQAGDAAFSPAPDATFSLTINKKPVTIALTATVISKVYDGNTNANISAANLTFGTNDVLSGDQLDIVLSSTTASYGTADVGTAKAITVPLGNISLGGTSLANYEIANTVNITANVGEITKAPITGITFTDANFNYDGTAKSLAIMGTLPTGATLSYTNNGQTAAGSYTVTANMNGGNNYQDLTLTAQLTINKAQIAGISFAGGNFVYDGTAKSLLITGALPTGVTVSYVGNGQVNAGIYTVTANINGGTTYEDQTLTATLSINKAVITGISLADANFNYDGIAKSLAITGTLPTDVTVSYTGNGQVNVGTYVVMATINGKSNYQNQSLTAQLSITKAPLIITANNASMCQGSNLPTFTASYSGFKNGENQNNLITRPSLSTTATSSATAGTYVITASGAVSDNYEITYVNGNLSVNALPLATVTSNKGNSISKGETLTLTATGGTSYSWTGDGILSGQNSAVLTIRPAVTATYTVTVGNANGCSSSASYTITVREDFATIKATNILTPNGDGINDVWKVENIDMYPNNTVIIFDKAGRILYQQKSYKNTWNGTINGSLLSEGTYYYVIDFGDAKPKQKGFITLLR